MPKPLYVLNGPNLNLLGRREPDVYGFHTLAEAATLATERAKSLGYDLIFRQTNHEGVLIDWVQESGREASGLVINPAGYGHTSVALFDALKIVPFPVIECHVSNPFRREGFRRHSYVSLMAAGVICGLGISGYGLAVEAVIGLLSTKDRNIALS